MFSPQVAIFLCVHGFIMMSPLFKAIDFFQCRKENDATKINSVVWGFSIHIFKTNTKSIQGTLFCMFFYR